MKINTTDRRWWLSACALCLVVTVMCTGCEPLRKKFTRQKKKDKEATGDFIPVLEPQEYPVKKYGSLEQYGQQYALFNVWLSDFADNFETIENGKKLTNDLDDALKSLGEMSKLVKGPVVDGLENIKKQVQYLREEYAKPKAFRNVSRMTSEVRSAGMTMRKKLKPQMIKDSLIAE